MKNVLMTVTKEMMMMMVMMIILMNQIKHENMFTHTK